MDEAERCRNQAFFEQDPFLLAARQQPYWLGCLVSTPIWGLISTRLRRTKELLSLGFLIFTGGVIGFATIQPNDDIKSLAFAGLAGIGFGGLIVLILASIQLSVPHELIATATAITVSSRSVAAAVFTTIYVTAFSDQLTKKLPKYIASAALQAGLPGVSIPAFVAALTGQDEAALPLIKGITPQIIQAGVVALKQAYADSMRVVFIIAVPFGVLAAISCWFIADLHATMNYKVDAPVENLKTKVQDPRGTLETKA